MFYDVTPTDIANRWRALTPDETDIAEFLISDAADQVDIKRPAVATIVAGDPGGKVYRAVRQLIIDAVQRVLRNPDVMDAQQIGADGSLGFQFRTDNELKIGQSGLRCQIADADLALLDAAIFGPTGATARAGVFMMILQDPT